VVVKEGGTEKGLGGSNQGRREEGRGERGGDGSRGIEGKREGIDVKNEKGGKRRNDRGCRIGR